MSLPVEREKPVAVGQHLVSGSHRYSSGSGAPSLLTNFELCLGAATDSMVFQQTLDSALELGNAAKTG